LALGMSIGPGLAAGECGGRDLSVSNRSDARPLD
jgi:hypothetical protein